MRCRLEALLPRRALSKMAREVGLCRRERKVQVAPFFWSLVLGFAGGRTRSLAGLRRSYEETTGTRLAPSAFYDRFTPALVRLLKAVVGMLLATVASPGRALLGPLAAFRDLVIADSTVIRLHALLAPTFPGCRTNHTKAALKLHTVLSATGAGPRSLKVTSERVHDGPVFKVGPWVRDRLLLFDLGYFRFQLFSCIERNGGFFIVRLKRSANPTVVSLNRRWRGRSIAILGQRVWSFAARLKRHSLDAMVDADFKRRVYAGVRHTATQRLRLVGVLDPVRTQADDVVGADDPGRQRRLEWATLLKRAYAVDVLRCPRCAGPMRLVAVMLDERVARRILEHLGLPARAPPRGRPWRVAGKVQLALDDPDRYDGVDPTYPN